jgi:hypothetical protein
MLLLNECLFLLVFISLWLSPETFGCILPYSAFIRLRVCLIFAFRRSGVSVRVLQIMALGFSYSELRCHVLVEMPAARMETNRKEINIKSTRKAAGITACSLPKQQQSSSLPAVTLINSPTSVVCPHPEVRQLCWRCSEEEWRRVATGR